ncbi:MAG: NAD(P)H-dependent oxidoreductase [Alphaproteobacteria bacterium]|nr:NAD(P)H-dependent oxidoreductase [Alphaproteobacteria bacterium]
MTASNQRPVHMLAICGSLRRNSYNRGLLRAAQKVKPEGVTIEEFDLIDIPMFNPDAFDATGFPKAVQDFRARIKAADAILIATPEYNYSLPGVLKNAIDWASRPPEQPFAKKPIAIMGATLGAWGTTRAQYHLRQVCVFLDMLPINKPEVLVPLAAQKFDKESNLTDEATMGFVRDLVVSLATWTNQLRAG